MAMTIVRIDGGGSADKEYVLLKASADLNLKGWVLADTTFDAKGNASNKTRHTYWFPDKAVKAGDYIAVFTRMGTDSPGAMTSKERCHFFYWNLKTSVWNNDGDTAVLLATHTTQQRKTT